MITNAMIDSITDMFVIVAKVFFYGLIGLIVLGACAIFMGVCVMLYDECKKRKKSKKP